MQSFTCPACNQRVYFDNMFCACGRWQLLPDNSLELTLSDGQREVRERIWFTKPNLRLRSTLESAGNGSPSRASFCSEIRRVSRPAAASAAPAG